MINSSIYKLSNNKCAIIHHTLIAPFFKTKFSFLSKRSFFFFFDSQNNTLLSNLITNSYVLNSDMLNSTRKHLFLLSCILLTSLRVQAFKKVICSHNLCLCDISIHQLGESSSHSLLCESPSGLPKWEQKSHSAFFPHFQVTVTFPHCLKATQTHD